MPSPELWKATARPHHTTCLLGKEVRDLPSLHMSSEWICKGSLQRALKWTACHWETNKKIGAWFIPKKNKAGCGLGPNSSPQNKRLRKEVTIWMAKPKVNNSMVSVCNLNIQHSEGESCVCGGRRVTSDKAKKAVDKRVIKEPPKFLENAHNRVSLDPLPAQWTEATSQVNCPTPYIALPPFYLPPHQHTHPVKHKLLIASGRGYIWREEQEKPRGSTLPLRA